MAQDPKRWKLIERIFHEIAAAPSDRRAEALDRLCSNDQALRATVQRLMRADADPEFIIDKPAVGPPASADGDRSRPPDGLIGMKLQSYRIVEHIGEGGMGDVYRARRDDELGDYDVAVKVVRRGMSTDDMLRRFHAERRVLAQLNHPSIARILDGGSVPDGRPYLVMEYIDGVPIDTYCDERKMSVEARLRLFSDVLKAVHFAHQNLVVHRDLKAGNILVSNEGVLKLLDFGLAKILDSDGQESQGERTATQARMLTPEYASPEQVLGAPVTTATDVYSLGVVMYSLLTGRKPYRITSRRLEEMGKTIREVEPVRPSTSVVRASDVAAGEKTGDHLAALRGTSLNRLRTRLAGDLDNIVMMALRKESDRRYASCEQFAADIERHLKQMPVMARADTFRYRASKFLQRNRVGVVTTATIVLTIVAGVVSTVWMARNAAMERDHATIEASSVFEIADFLTEMLVLGSGDLDPDRRKRLFDRLDAEAVRVRKQFADQRHLEANLIDALGHVYLDLGQFDQAEALLREAGDIRLSEFGPRSLEMAVTHAGLGQLFYVRGEYDRAEREFQQCLHLHRTQPRGVHTDVGTALNNVAVTMRVLGRGDEAEALHREALEVRRVANGASSPQVAESLNNLAAIMLDRGSLPEAIDLLSEALEIRTAILGPTDPDTAQAINNLAVLIHRQGDLERAEDFYQQAIEVYRSIGATGRDGLARTLPNLSDIYLRTNRTNDALLVLEEAMDIELHRLHPDHPVIASILAKLAPTYETFGRYDEAESAWLRSISIREKSFSPKHSLVGLSLYGYGWFLIKSGRAAEAESPLHRALDIFQSDAEADPVNLATAQVALGVCLTHLKRFSDAEPLLLAALELIDYEGDPFSNRETIRAHLVTLYEEWEKPERASEFRTKE